jgi:predicted RNA binding protein YcfA (HicA-like mRNA interferase family)
MPRLPRVTAREAAVKLRLLGFAFVRQKGSHRIYKNKIGRCITIPFHGSKILRPKILKSIMEQADVADW